MSKKGIRSNFVVIFLVFNLTLLPVLAQVEDSDSVVVERIRLIQKMLDRDKRGANGWWYGWLAGYSAATIVQGVVAVSTNERATRQDMLLGAGTTLLGAAGQLITPNTPGRAADQLERITEETGDARLHKLQRAEELLKESALSEKRGRSWKLHAITGVVNLTSGLITWLGFDRDVWAGLGNFALNTVITESQIWTTPTRAMKDYKEYCRRYKTANDPVLLKQNITWFVNPYPGGIKIKIVF